jgi:hypothetical protein
LDAHVDEQRRKQADARVPFLLVTCSLGKQRKVTRLGAKSSGEKQCLNIKEIPFKASNEKAHYSVRFFICD